MYTFERVVLNESKKVKKGPDCLSSVCINDTVSSSCETAWFQVIPGSSKEKRKMRKKMKNLKFNLAQREELRGNKVDLICLSSLAYTVRVR